MATTTNYTWDLPTVGGDEDTWGTKLNGNWTALDTLLGGVNATEFAILDGATVTTAELNLLDGVTWTLTDYNTLTATAAELNVVDGITGKTGADTTLVTGTAGADGDLVQWNADGDLVSYGAATQTQATWEAGTSTTESLVTPAKVKAAIEALAPSYIKAFVAFDGTGTPNISASQNVASITDNGTGDYTINFSSALASADYVVQITTSQVSPKSTMAFVVSKTTSSVRINVLANTSGENANPVLNDTDDINVIVVG